MEKTAKIYVAGHHGLVGSAIWNNLQQKGYTNLVGRSHKELDLLDGQAVKKFFDEEQPQYVILAAAHVGGIMANSLYRADFIYQNLQIQQNVIGESFRHDVKKLLFLGSNLLLDKCNNFSGYNKCYFILIRENCGKCDGANSLETGKRPRFIEHTTLFPFLIDIWR